MPSNLILIFVFYSLDHLHSSILVSSSSSSSHIIIILLGLGSRGFGISSQLQSDHWLPSDGQSFRRIVSDRSLWSQLCSQLNCWLSKVLSGGFPVRYFDSRAFKIYSHLCLLSSSFASSSSYNIIILLGLGSRGFGMLQSDHWLPSDGQSFRRIVSDRSLWSQLCSQLNCWLSKVLSGWISCTIF